MSYDLHVVRTENWLDASEKPISNQDVNALITEDSELEWSKNDYVDMKDEKGVLTRYFAINWRNSACFLWYQDQIICSNPDKPQRIKLIKIAQLLHAYVTGDDDERYELRKNIFGKEKVIIVSPEDF